MKTCSKCGIEKDESEFSKDKRIKIGLKSWCKKCDYECYKKYRTENPEKIKERQKKWRTENPEKIENHGKKLEIQFLRTDNKEIFQVKFTAFKVVYDISESKFDELFEELNKYNDVKIGEITTYYLLNI